MGFLMVIFVWYIDAASQKAHVHGHANGNIVILDRSIVIEMTIPAISVVGFERAPETKEEKERVAKAINTLKQSTLFTFYKDLGWFKEDEILEVSLLKSETELIGLHDGHTHKHEHTEFTVKLHYELKGHSSIDAISTTFFDHISHVDELELDGVKDNGDFYLELSKRNHKDDI